MRQLDGDREIMRGWGEQYGVEGGRTKNQSVTLSNIHMLDGQ